MVSTSPCKKEDAVAVSATTTTLNSKRINLVPGPNPLSKHRFYLDVKNHISSGKLESRIKELGGLLELFLVKEVTHVVTDKEGWASTSSKGGGINPTTPQTPSNQSAVHNEYGSADCTPKRGRPKTRADAMLERARKTPTIVAKDPLEQAKNWGTTIWTVEKALLWLEKVSDWSIKKTKHRTNVRELTAPYVKFESFDRKHRPVFKEIRNWPSFYLKGPCGSSGLVHRTSGTDKQNMTRKSRNTQQPQTHVADAAAQAGYCEVCRAEYARLDEHLESDKHLAFVKDNANFLELDRLIDDGTNFDTFLKIHGSVKEAKCNGLEHNAITDKMPRTRNSSICDKIKTQPILTSETESYTRRSNRKRKDETPKFNDSSVTEDELPIQLETRELRSSHRNALLKIAEQESETWNSGRPKRSCIRQKRISVDDNVISENKGYYKVEVPNNESPIEEEAFSEREDEDDKSLIVKFRRMRSSELKRLNNEAENFLFPKRDETSSEEDIDANHPDTTLTSEKCNESTLILSSEEDDEEKSMDSCASSECSNKKKKRLSHAEAFILDNKKYYKFEMPGSRLRYQGSFMADITPMQSPGNNGDVAAVKMRDIKKEAKQYVDDGKFKLDDLTFSFEQVPKSEPWYQTFSRQDQGEEYYTCFSDSGCWKPFLMPYEMGPIPPLDPKICFNHYTQIKKQILDEVTSGSNSASCSTPDPNSNDGIPELQEDNSKNSDDSTYTTNVETDNDSSVRKQRSKPGTSAPSRNPRKSPRQHASTLAILSSLIHQRKKNRAKNSDSKLDIIPENTEADLSNSYEKQAKTIDDMLTGAFEDFRNLDQIEIAQEDDLLNLKYKSSAIEILQDYESSKKMGSKIQKCPEPRKKPWRKKKKNRTGWPNKNIRRVKKEVLIEDDSTVDSLSVNADSEHSNYTDLNDFGITEFVNKTDQSKNKSVVYKNNKTSEINVQKSEDRVKRNSDRVVDLDRWENAEKVLSTKLSNNVNKDLQFQPYVRVQKLDDDNIKTVNNRRLRSSSSPHRTTKRQRRMPASPKSPRVLRKPRGRWYRER